MISFLLTLCSLSPQHLNTKHDCTTSFSTPRTCPQDQSTILVEDLGSLDFWTRLNGHKNLMSTVRFAVICLQLFFFLQNLCNVCVMCVVNVPFTFALFGCVSSSQRKCSPQQKKLLDHMLKRATTHTQALYHHHAVILSNCAYRQRLLLDVQDKIFE